MKQVTWKKIMFLCVLLCPPVLLTESEGFHRPEGNKVCCPAAVYESRLSITRELWPNGQTRQRWSNINQYSVTLMPISLLKCFRNHLVVHNLAVKWERLCRGPPLWNLLKEGQTTGHMTGAQPIGTTLSIWNDLWLVKVSRHGLDISKAWKQSHEEEQKSSFLSEHLNYNMLKGYYGIFAQWCQTHTAYCHFKWEVLRFWASNT